MTARCRNRIVFAMAALAALWLLAASRVHVNASWSDGAWGYLALPILGEPELGDVVLFDPPASIDADVPYLKTVRGLPGARVEVRADRAVSVDGLMLGFRQDPRPQRPAAGGDRTRHGAPPATTSSTARTRTATTAATRRSGSSRARASGPGPWHSRICRGLAWQGR